MSNDAVNWAYRQKCPSPGAKFVLVTLCDFADDQGFCYPSQKTVAQMTQQGERTVRAHLASLEQAGLIRRDHRANPDGTFKSDGFHIQRQILPTAKMAAGRKREKVDIAADYPAADSADGEIRQRRELPQPAADSAKIIEIPPRPPYKEELIKGTISEPSGGARTPAPPRMTLATFQPNEKQIDDAIGYGVAPEQIAFETEQWRDYHAERGTPIKDLAASWRRWMRNAPGFNRPRAPTNGNGHRFVTKQEQIDINNEEAEAEFAAIVNGSGRHGSAGFPGTNQPPRGGVSGGHPGEDPRRLLPRVPEDRR